MTTQTKHPLALLSLPAQERFAALHHEIDYLAGFKRDSWLALDGAARSVFVKYIRQRPRAISEIYLAGASASTRPAASLRVRLVGPADWKVAALRSPSDGPEAAFAAAIDPSWQSVHTVALSWGKFSKKEIMQAASRWAGTEWERRNKKRRRRDDDPQTGLKELVAYCLRIQGVPVEETRFAVNSSTGAAHDERWVRRAVDRTKERIEESRSVWEEHYRALRE